MKVYDVPLKTFRNNPKKFPIFFLLVYEKLINVKKRLILNFKIKINFIINFK